MIAENQEGQDDGKEQKAFIKAEHDEHANGDPEKDKADQALHTDLLKSDSTISYAENAKKSFLFGYNQL